MEFLVAAVVLLTLLAFLCLLLLLGLTRRLRTHSERIAELEKHRHLRDSGLELTIGEFEVTRSDDGEPLTRTWLVGAESLVAFVAYGCPSCKSQLPALRAYAERGERVLAVVARVPGETPDPAGMHAALGDSVVLAEEPFGGAAQVAFQVAAYPTFYLVDEEGRAVAAGSGVREVLGARQPERTAAGAR
ncbi:hypothetical protein AB0E69_35510 [Kribbella sp. NPDC026611]|uniref:hypothetical protein n=1 Tax=Kribbella sp. NPDC026611 TaxID=3154911 RepID=UPI0034015837